MPDGVMTTTNKPKQRCAGVKSNDQRYRCMQPATTDSLYCKHHHYLHGRVDITWLRDTDSD